MFCFWFWHHWHKEDEKWIDMGTWGYWSSKGFTVFTPKTRWPGSCTKQAIQVKKEMIMLECCRCHKRKTREATFFEYTHK